MAFEQEIDPRSAHVAQFLRRNGVSLWEPPYWNNDKADIPEELVAFTSQECHLSYEMSLGLLLELQRLSLQRVRERQLLKEQGLLTIKVKMQRAEHRITMAESSSIATLYEKISETTKIATDRIKLIHNGQILSNENVSLPDKEIKNNTKIVALVTSAEIEKHIQAELQITTLKGETSRAKSDAKTLSALNQCEITNQFGAKVAIPDTVKLDLTAALSLHSKGRFEMNKDEPENALSYLLEAERIFQGIDTTTYPILDQSSNIALLNLDIAWCFLQLGSLSHLSDGERRLLVAEEGLLKAYGPNMERVRKTKGSATNEQTFYVRLRLLQGVGAFYKANYAEARLKFSQAETLIENLRVNEDNLITLMSFGYSDKESRLALRQTNNDLELALRYLEEKKMIREGEYKLWKHELQEKYLKGINKTLYDRMIGDIGVSAATARRALLRHGNNYNEAVSFALELECTLNKARQEKDSELEKRRTSDDLGKTSTVLDESGPSSVKVFKKSTDFGDEISTSDVAALVGMGLEEKSAKHLLEFFKGSLSQAENYLLTGRAEGASQLDLMLSEMRRFVSKETEDYLDTTLEKELECLSVFTARLAQIDSTSQ